MSTAVVAVDFGASSVRVCRAELGDGPPVVGVVHRHRHAPVPDGSGVLRWDWTRLLGELDKGLAAALEQGPVASIGVATWGVDYGLLDARGELVSPPISYRDRRTDGYHAVVQRIGGFEALYAITGVQLQPFNTLFQVAVHDRDELDAARHLVLLPELVVHRLTGEVVGERTSAGTTGLVDVRSGKWSPELAESVGLDPALLPEILTAGSAVGTWQGVPVHLVGGHDTASAVVAMGADPGVGSAFVSAGTWLLVGREQDEPDLSAAAREANFTNEVGALGGVRFLKNLAGAWLIEGCRPAWGDPPVAGLLREAATSDVTTRSAGATLLDVADPRLLNPETMLAAVAAGLGLPVDSPPPLIVRGIVDSQAAETARVIDQLGEVGTVNIFGGAQSHLYRDLLARRTGLPVGAGPVEATALGNALVQGVAIGVYDDLADARRSLGATHPEGTR